MILMHEYYKQKLNIQAKKIYEALLANISSLAFEGKVQLYIPYNDAVIRDAGDAYYSLKLDRPEYYFLAHTIGISAQSNGVLVIQQDKRFSRQQILRINRLLRIRIKEIIAGTENKELLKKEQLIYRNVGKRYRYKDGKYSHDLSGLLVYKEGVCESLTGMLVIALREAGIPAIEVRGYARNERHCWCKVWIDNQEYYLDVTWDMRNCRCGIWLNYFNLTHKQMLKEHQLIEDISELRSNYQC